MYLCVIILSSDYYILNRKGNITKYQIKAEPLHAMQIFFFLQKIKKYATISDNLLLLCMLFLLLLTFEDERLWLFRFDYYYCYYYIAQWWSNAKIYFSVSFFKCSLYCFFFVIESVFITCNLFSRLKKSWKKTFNFYDDQHNFFYYFIYWKVYRF